MASSQTKGEYDNYNRLGGRVGCDGGFAGDRLLGADTKGPDPVVSIADTRIPESDVGATEAEFSVVLTPASEQIVTVDYATEDGTAEAGKDYAATNGTLTFSAGERTKTIIVAIIDDALVEPDETFTVTLSNPSNAALADAMATAVGTVTNDDTGPVISIDDTRIPESDGGPTEAEFSVVLTPASEQGRYR